MPAVQADILMFQSLLTHLVILDMLVHILLLCWRQELCLQGVRLKREEDLQHTIVQSRD